MLDDIPTDHEPDITPFAAFTVGYRYIYILWYGIGLEDWDIPHSNTNSAYGGRSPAQNSGGGLFRRRGKPLNGWSEADKRIPYEYQEWCSRWSSDWLRVLKPGGTCFVFACRRYAHRCIAALEDSGFSFKDMLA